MCLYDSWKITRGFGGAGPLRSSVRALAFLARVASVSNRVIARKVEQKQKKGWRGRGRGEEVPSFPSPSPVIHFFFCSYPSFLDEPREETLATQAIAFQQCRVQIPQRRRHMWVEFVVGFSSLLQVVSPVSPVLIIQPNPIFFFQFHQYWLLVIQSLLHSPLSFMQCESSSKTTRHSIRNRQRWQLNHLDLRDLNLCFWFIYLWNGHYILSNLQAYPFVKWLSTPQC